MDRGLGAFKGVAQILQPLDALENGRGPFPPLRLAEVGRVLVLPYQPRLLERGRLRGIDGVASMAWDASLSAPPRSRRWRRGGATETPSTRSTPSTTDAMTPSTRRRDDFRTATRSAPTPGPFARCPRARGRRARTPLRFSRAPTHVTHPCGRRPTRPRTVGTF